MNILLLGSGGREHAIAWKISQSKLNSRLFIAPGNAGTSDCGINIDISIKDFEAIKSVVLLKKISLVIVGPEEPLVNGIVDFFLSDEELKKVHILGPSREGARLEGSKDYAKKFMYDNDIPTAAYKSFQKNEIQFAKDFLTSLNPPYVIKADGLAAGKGVVICYEIPEAEKCIDEMLADAKFGEAGNKIVIEEFLDGIELSVFVLTDGSSYKILPEAKDYKRIGDNDTGPNTGGMGAVSPVPFAGKEFLEKVEKKIIRPTIDGLRSANIYYRGFIFIGLMKVNDEPFVIEYNVRMGDPETEVIFPRIESDVVELLNSAASGNLDSADLKISGQTALTLMLVSGGYPGQFEKGKTIAINNGISDSIVFHAGTSMKNEFLITNGGRVLSVTSFGRTIAEARKKSYTTASQINFEKMYFRKDIGLDLIKS
jgi:phosphoribosylamine--glycine ligase